MALVQKLRLSLLNLPKAFTTTCIRENCNRAAITKTNRTKYARSYPTLLVQADGSTVRIRHHEPRKIVVMPVDLSALSNEDKQARLAKRKPKRKIIIEEDIDDGYDASRYSHLWKK